MTRRIWIAFSSASAMLLAALLVTSHVVSAQDDHAARLGGSASHASRIQLGLHFARAQGIELDPTPQNRALVGLGSYLVNMVASCNDCHTFPPFAAGGDPYQRQPKQLNITNYLAGGVSFGPGICSANITPDPVNGQPAGLSREDFIYVMRTGCDPEGANFRDPASCDLLQVMPWPSYQGMNLQDLSAIYAHLSAILHAEPAVNAPCTP